ncbi:MAG: DUF3619 family protein [Burkholderiales bacterium]
MTTTPELHRELRTALAVKRYLDASAARLPDGAAERLRAARERALIVQKREAVGGMALAGGRGSFGIDWIWRIAPIVVLVVGLFGIKMWHEARLAEENLDIDTRILLDEVPPNAYLDKGFGAWLSRQGQ